ncbi:hypothetical protein PM082_015457 [Marasmius tenuissimus]|nr:hypothetical protein PM082_015457 [Marasmius tenuissimus]
MTTERSKHLFKVYWDEKINEGLRGIDDIENLLWTQVIYAISVSDYPRLSLERRALSSLDRQTTRENPHVISNLVTL